MSVPSKVPIAKIPSGIKSTKTKSKRGSTPSAIPLPPSPASRATSIRMLPPLFKDRTDQEAPFAVTSSMTRSCSIAGSFDQGLRVRSLEPLAHLCYPNGIQQLASGQYGLFQMTGSKAGPTASPILIHPYVIGLKPGAMPYYEPYSTSAWNTGAAFPHGQFQYILGSAFSRYKCHGATLHYRPTCSTTEQPQITLAYSADPAHPVFGVTDTNADYPTTSKLDSSGNCMIFAAWSAWSMKLPITADWLFRYEGIKFGDGDTKVQADSDVRQSCFGCLSVIGPGSGSSDIQFGELYIEWDMEYRDPSPVTDSLVSPYGLSDWSGIQTKEIVSRLASKPREVKEEKKVVGVESKDPVIVDPDDDEVDSRLYKFVDEPSDVLPLGKPQLVRQSAYVVGPSSSSSSARPSQTPSSTPTKR